MCSPNNANGRKSGGKREVGADMEKAKVKLNSFVVFIRTHHITVMKERGNELCKKFNDPEYFDKNVARFCPPGPEQKDFLRKNSINRNLHHHQQRQKKKKIMISNQTYRELKWYRQLNFFVCSPTKFQADSLLFDCVVCTKARNGSAWPFNKAIN